MTIIVPTHFVVNVFRLKGELVQGLVCRVVLQVIVGVWARAEVGASYGEPTHSVLQAFGAEVGTVRGQLTLEHVLTKLH